MKIDPKVISDSREIRLNIRLPEKTRNEFRAICDAKALNASALIRQWIDKFIEDNRTTK